MTSERIDVYDIVERLRWSSMVRNELKDCEYADLLTEHLWRKKLATRSKIAVHLCIMDDDPLGVNPMERVLYRAVYVHWDGYPETRYPLLRHYYNSEDAARSIVELGDMSSLGPTLKDAVVYTGEDSNGPNDYTNFKDLVESTRGSMGEYLYLWQNGKWHVYSLNFSGDNGIDETRKCETTWDNGGYAEILKHFEGEKR